MTGLNDLQNTHTQKGYSLYLCVLRQEIDKIVNELQNCQHSSHSCITKYLQGAIDVAFFLPINSNKVYAHIILKQNAYKIWIDTKDCKVCGSFGDRYYERNIDALDIDKYVANLYNSKTN